MKDFKTLDGAIELFKQVDGLGNNNNIFMTLKNTTRESMKYGVAGGMAAGIGVGVLVTGNSETIFGNNFDALLINQTEKGLGLIPMHSKKIVLTNVKIENLEPDLAEYAFIANDSIEEIKVKNFSFLNKKLQTIKIKVGDKNTLHLVAKKQEKLLSYQEENFGKFMDQYKKK